MVDYYSRYVEVQRLTSTTATSVINVLKAWFARHGIPEVMVSDNGPQYASQEMRESASSYGFTHVTSSPHYPQSNGQAGRAVKMVKALLEHSPDPFMDLLSYRATPFPWCRLSPAELRVGRRLRTNVPQAKEMLVPNWPHTLGFKDLDHKQKERQKSVYDKRHRVQESPALLHKRAVWVEHQGQHIPGEVTEQTETPRSYRVETESEELRRNRKHLHPRPDNDLGPDPCNQS